MRSLTLQQTREVSMTTALVCIMKNEDRHFEEWIGYHLSIGFDKVIVMCNDWDPGDN